ncbi:MAG: hypothetical protein KKA64_02875 [Nanoarchaeota archaeon]|nr:hypothetical protein [Nanoarchaeota archaeon]
MGKDRKHMKKLRKKRISSIQKQVEKHGEKIEKEKGRKDTTKDYWRKEINDKFLKQIEKDEDYLEEQDGSSDKKSS